MSPRCGSGLPCRPAGRPPRAGVLVLQEVFGINSWVRSVAGRLAVAGYGALVVPLFARTAPELELLSDLVRAADWLSPRLPDPVAPLGCVGFCFGGPVAMLVWSVAAQAVPPLDLVPHIPCRLLCFCGDRDPLIPPREVGAIARQLARGSPPADPGA